MHFEAVDTVSHPAALILETMIERMEAIVPFLPNVESIETLDVKRLKDERIRIRRRWQGKADSMSAALRPFLPRDILAWLDTALWVPAEYRVEWMQSTCVAGVAQLYDCSGVNYFEPDPDDPQRRTCIRITGDLQIHPERLPGVPRFLAQRLAPQVEKFIVGLITPNLTDLAKGLQRYFDAQQKPRRQRRASGAGE
jgi:hypothetical protein